MNVKCGLHIMHCIKLYPWKNKFSLMKKKDHKNVLYYTPCNRASFILIQSQMNLIFKNSGISPFIKFKAVPGITLITVCSFIKAKFARKVNI